MSTPQSAAATSAPSLGNQLATPPNLLTPLCEAGCGRPVTKGSGGRWCWWDDPTVPAAEKLQARQLGGRRGLMGSAEAALLLDGSSLETTAGRHALRAKLAAARAAGRISSAMMRDLLAAVSDAAKDQDRQGKLEKPPVIVEVERYSQHGAQATQEPAE